MKNADIKDPLFLEAVTAIDEGNLETLKWLLDQHPSLVSQPLDHASGDYFDHPFLIWFVADNPIRIPQLPDNVLSITSLLIDQVKRNATATAKQQLNYTLGLIATGRIPRESGRQTALIDLLIDAGAEPGNGVSALAHGNTEAAARLLERGGKLTLPLAVGLNRLPDILNHLHHADADQRLTALTVAAFYGNADMIALLLDLGFKPNGYPSPESGFHSHATPLHQAVYSGSRGSVELLADAGASLEAKDKIFGSTPHGWAEHMAQEAIDAKQKHSYEVIAAFLSKF